MVFVEWSNTLKKKFNPSKISQDSQILTIHEWESWQKNDVPVIEKKTKINLIESCNSNNILQNIARIQFNFVWYFIFLMLRNVSPKKSFHHIINKIFSVKNFFFQKFGDETKQSSYCLFQGLSHFTSPF